jgi:hypothetical protein
MFGFGGPRRTHARSFHRRRALSHSTFTALEPWPEFETIEKRYRDNLYIVLELYPRQNGTYLVRPRHHCERTSPESPTLH